jgi:hypothetical protein
VDWKGTVVVFGGLSRRDNEPEITTVVAGDGKGHYPVILDNGGELLLVRGVTFERGIEIFRVDVENRTLETIKCIGSRAIFRTTSRCLSVDTHNLPTIQGNCIYDFFSSGHQIRIHHLKDDRVEPVRRSPSPMKAPSVMLRDAVFVPRVSWNTSRESVVSSVLVYASSSFSSSYRRFVLMELKIELCCTTFVLSVYLLF